MFCCIFGITLQIYVVFLLLLQSQKLSPPLRKGRKILVMRFDEFRKFTGNDFDLDMYEDKNKHLDILKFWRDHARVYPKLALVARLILACPASSTPSERSFSQAGWTINLRHTRLAPRNLTPCCASKAICQEVPGRLWSQMSRPIWSKRTQRSNS